MEWTLPAVVLALQPHGEGDAVASVLTEQGRHRGLARGGASRSGTATWQPGNVVQARWIGRLPEQLGSMTAELVYPAASHAMDHPLALSVLSAACAVAEAALPEREPHGQVFTGLVELLARLDSPDAVTALVRWETVLLTELGYGLDLSACAVSGERSGLRYVSPRTGRAVSDASAGDWRARLLALPGFLVGGNSVSAQDWRDGLRLTGHFLEREVFGPHGRPLPAARNMLYDRVCALAA